MTVQKVAKKNPLTKWKWQQWIGVLISIGCLFAAVWGIDFRKTGEYLQSANSGLLLIALFSVVITLVAKALRWRILLRSEKPVGWFRCFKVINIGILLNTIFPARVGDLARAYIMGESENERKVYLIGTIVIEKIWDGTALLLTAFCLGWVLILPEWLLEPLQIVAFVTVFVFINLLIFYWLWRSKQLKINLISRWGKMGQWLGIQIRAVADTLDRLRHERVLFSFSLWTLLIVFLGALTNYLLFFAFDLHLSFLTALFLLVVLMAGISVPSVPGRFGVYHYLVVISLALFGISKDLALAYGVVLHLITYLPTVLVGAYGLLKERTPWPWPVRKVERTPGASEIPNG